MEKITMLIAAAITIIMLTGCNGKPADAKPADADTPKQELSSEEDEEEPAQQPSSDDKETDEPEQDKEPEADAPKKAANGIVTPITEDSVRIMDMTADDLDMNSTRLGDIISSNKVTMLNYWGTFCGPCIREMPGLQELSQKYKDDGFGIIGLTCDIVTPEGGYDERAIEDARAILSETGVTYPIIIATEEINLFIDTEAIPMTYFVDSSGNLIGSSYLGSKSIDDWDPIISQLIEEVR